MVDAFFVHDALEPPQDAFGWFQSGKLPTNRKWAELRLQLNLAQ